MHRLTASQICGQLAHLFFFIIIILLLLSLLKNDIPSALHHQQDLDLVVALGICGDSWGKRAKGAVVNTGSGTFKRATWCALMHCNTLVGRKKISFRFDICSCSISVKRLGHLEAFAMKHESRCIHYLSLKGLPFLLSIHLRFRAIIANNTLHNVSRRGWVFSLQCADIQW